MHVSVEGSEGVSLPTSTAGELPIGPVALEWSFDPELDPADVHAHVVTPLKSEAPVWVVDLASDAEIPDPCIRERASKLEKKRLGRVGAATARARTVLS